MSAYVKGWAVYQPSGRLQSLLITVMEHNSACSLCVGTDGEDVEMEVTRIDLIIYMSS